MDSPGPRDGDEEEKGWGEELSAKGLGWAAL